MENPSHPEYGAATIPFPLPEREYEHSIEMLSELEAGDAINRDCLIREIDSDWAILKHLEGQTVNVDELDYLAKRLEGMEGESSQFQGMAVKLGLSDIKDLISFSINTKEKVRHFLAQCMYETYNGTLVAEVGYEAGVGGSKSYSPYYGAGYLHLTSKASYYSDPAPLNFYDYLKNTAKITDDKVKTPAAYATQHVAIKYPGRSAGWVWDKLKNINSSSVINWNSDSTTICTTITKLISGSSSTASDRHKNYADKICPILK